MCVYIYIYILMSFRRMTNRANLGVNTQEHQLKSEITQTLQYEAGRIKSGQCRYKSKCPNQLHHTAGLGTVQ